MTFDIKKLQEIGNLKLTEDDIDKLRKSIKDNKKLPDEWVQDFLVAAQNIIDAEDQREELVKNFMAIARIVLSFTLATI